MGETALVLQLIITLAERLSQTVSVLGKAQAEGREVSSKELDELFANDDVTRTKLQAEIDRQKNI